MLGISSSSRPRPPLSHRGAPRPLHAYMQQQMDLCKLCSYRLAIPWNCIPAIYNFEQTLSTCYQHHHIFALQCSLKYIINNFMRECKSIVQFPNNRARMAVVIVIDRGRPEKQARLWSVSTARGSVGTRIASLVTARAFPSLLMRVCWSSRIPDRRLSSARGNNGGCCSFSSVSSPGRQHYLLKCHAAMSKRAKCTALVGIHIGMYEPSHSHHASWAAARRLCRGVFIEAILDPRARVGHLHACQGEAQGDVHRPTGDWAGPVHLGAGWCPAYRRLLESCEEFRAVCHRWSN